MKIIHDENEQCSVHTMPRGRTGFHDRYGLWICSTGNCQGKTQAVTTFAPHRRYFQFYCISQLVSGRGFYTDFRSEPVIFDPGQGVLVSPEHVHCYGPYYDHYLENTICFAGRIADALKGTGYLPDGVLAIGPSQRLSDVIRLALNPSIHSQLAANLALQNLLFELHLENRPGSKAGDRLDGLAEEIQRDPKRWWTVGEMAEHCDMPEPQFRKQFRKRNGLSPKKFVDTLKTKWAMDLLRDRSLSVGEVADRLGYVDPFHFSRRFKELIGQSPRQYRQMALPSRTG